MVFHKKRHTPGIRIGDKIDEDIFKLIREFLLDCSNRWKGV